MTENMKMKWKKLMLSWQLFINETQKYCFINEKLKINDNEIAKEEYEKLVDLFYEELFVSYISSGKFACIYLDTNEYSNSHKNNNLLKKQREILDSNNFFKHLEIIKYAKHRKLSCPVVVTRETIIDKPSYVDLKIFNSKNINDWNNSGMNNFPAYCQEEIAKNHERYENPNGSKSKWIKDIKKGIIL